MARVTSGEFQREFGGMADLEPAVGLVIRHALRAWRCPVAYGLLPAAMTEDLVRQVKENARDRSLLVVSRDDPVLNEMIRRHRRSRKTKRPR